MSTQPFTRAHPCPVCGGHADMPAGKGVRCWGFLSTDGQYAHCVREEHAGGLPIEQKSSTFAHRLGAPCKCGVAHGGDIRPNVSPATKRTVANRYEYRIVDAKGELVTKHVRVEYEDGEKTFFFDPPIKPRGIERDSLPLYNLPKLLAAPKDAPVIVTEGEKKCDALNRIGILAVATATGSGGTPDDEALRPLLGHRVFLWPDHANDGRAHMNRIAASLARLGTKPRMIAWLEAGPKEDAGNYIARGGTTDGVRALMHLASSWTPTVSPSSASTSLSQADGPAEKPAPSAPAAPKPWPAPHTDGELIEAAGRPVLWLVEPIIARGHVLLIYGVAKGMKSSLAVALAQAAEAGEWPCGGFYVPRRSRVAILNFEDGVARIARRLGIVSKQIAAPRNPLVWSAENAPPIRLPRDEARVVDWIGENKIELLFLDTIAYTYGDEVIDENNAAQVQAWAGSVRRIATKTSAGLGLLTHARKSGRGTDAMQNAARGSSVLSGLADALLLVERREDRSLSIECVGKDAPPQRWIAHYDPAADQPWRVEDATIADTTTGQVYRALVELTQEAPLRVWSSAEVAERAQVSDNTARKELKELASKGRAEPLDRPGKGGGVGYRAKEPFSAAATTTQQPPKGGLLLSSSSVRSS